MQAVWIFTQAFGRKWHDNQLTVPAEITVTDIGNESSEAQLLALRQLAVGGTKSVTIFDQGRLEGDLPWCYVSGVVSKSGVNPLRGLGSVMSEPFVDVSTLYHVPQKATGLTITALGSRFETATDLVPACGDLHDLAILAHTEGIAVTGVVIDEARIATMNWLEFNAS